jgi:hypothetical protein
MKNTLLITLILMVSSSIKAQEISSKLYFNISYFGILGTHPGIKFGVQHPVITFDAEDAANKLHQLIGSSSVILYFHRRNQFGAGLNVEFGYRNRRAGKTNGEITMGLGILRTFLPKRVYDFDEAGGFTEKKFAGNTHFLKTVSIGMGKNSGDYFPASFWMIRPTLFHLSPYNTGSTLNFALDAGYYFK